MAQPWDVRRDTAFSANNVETNEGSTLRLADVQTNEVDIPTQPLSESAVTDDLSETTVPLPAIELLPTVKRAVTKVPTTNPPVPRRRLASLLVALGVFLVANVVVQFNRNYFDTLSDGFATMSRIQKCESLGRVPDVLFTGSSRVVYSVDPSLIDSQVQAATGKKIVSCNVATFGSAIDHDYYTLKRLIDDGYAPKVVVENAWEYPLNVMAAGSSGNYSAADKNSSLLLEAPWLATMGDFYDLRQRFRSGSNATLQFANFMLNRAVPVYGDRYGLLRLICNGTSVGPCTASLPGVDALSVQRYQSADAQGFVPLTGQSIADLTPAQKNRATHGEFSYGKNLQNFTIGGNQVTYLHMFIELAQAHHIRVDLVTSPLNSTYFAYLKPATDWKTIIVPFWKKIAAQYHIHYYDESHAAQFTDADFWDPEHLDIVGAEKFSSWLAQTIVAPALNG